MSVELHDPRGEQARAPEPYELAVPLTEGTVVGLLANGFPDSVAFVERVGEALAAIRPGVELRLWDKGDASRPAPGELLDTIAAECRAVVAAYGH